MCRWTITREGTFFPPFSSMFFKMRESKKKRRAHYRAAHSLLPSEGRRQTGRERPNCNRDRWLAQVSISLNYFKEHEGEGGEEVVAEDQIISIIRFNLVCQLPNPILKDMKYNLMSFIHQHQPVQIMKSLDQCDLLLWIPVQNLSIHWDGLGWQPMVRTRWKTYVPVDLAVPIHSFDSINHGILLDHLTGLGLEDTFQKLALGHSWLMPLIYGILQGSIFSPVLFNIDIKLLGDVIKRSELYCHLLSISSWRTCGHFKSVSPYCLQVDQKCAQCNHVFFELFSTQVSSFPQDFHRNWYSVPWRWQKKVLY